MANIKVNIKASASERTRKKTKLSEFENDLNFVDSDALPQALQNLISPSTVLQSLQGFADKDMLNERLANYLETVNEYTVTFLDWEGTILSTQSVIHGSSATAPTDPTREGYTFIGWNTTFDNVTSNLNVTAEYSEIVNKYTVTFLDWDYTVLKTEQVAYGSGATAPSDPTRATTDRGSYTFANWDVAFNNIAEDLTVTAVYSFTPNAEWDGVVAVSAIVTEGATSLYDFTYGEEYPSWLNSFSRGERWTLLGWFTEENGQGEQIIEGTLVTNELDHTIYAHWQENPTILTIKTTLESGNEIPIYLNKPDTNTLYIEVNGTIQHTFNTSVSGDFDEVLTFDEDTEVINTLKIWVNRGSYGLGNGTSSTVTIGGVFSSQRNTLKEAIISNPLTNIVSYAFYGCSSLTDATIQDSVASIGNNAFEHCNSLTSVTMQSTTPPTLGVNAFNNTHSTLKIYVPSESVDAYKNASGWDAYSDKIEAILSS